VPAGLRIANQAFNPNNREKAVRIHGCWNASTNDSARALRARLDESSDLPGAAIRNLRRRPEKDLREIRYPGPGGGAGLLGEAPGGQADHQVALPARAAEMDDEVVVGGRNRYWYGQLTEEEILGSLPERPSSPELCARSRSGPQDHRQGQRPQGDCRTVSGHRTPDCIAC
jgi:hypothetical protein